MSDERITTEVGGRTVELTHLDKVLYPETGFTKAEVIDYYARVGSVLLPHISHRALTLKRYPDGVAEPPFFQKECPEHRPGWLPVVEVPSSRKGTIRFCSVDDLAGLVWLVNTGSIEIHSLLSRGDDHDHPTHVVFDLDPGPPAGWPEVVQVARSLVRELHALDLTTVVVSSGSKGIHVAVPLDGSVGYDRSKEFARSLAQRLSAAHPDLVVVTMAKAKRKGRVLVDWSQNDRHKSTVSVYSLRARSSPTAAFPLLDGELDRLAEGELDLDRLLLGPEEVLARIDEHGDLAEALVTGPGRDLPDTEPLATYRSMRRFGETPEPAGDGVRAPAAADRPRFVIQEHHATSLHWDLRLEHDGVLVSFAVPKGLPWSPDEDHLAVHTEDHPLEYLDFAGEIPEGSYGAGRMGIWDEGTYEPEEMAEDKFKFVLHGRRVEGRYAIFPWKGRNWMVHRMDPPQDPTRSPLPTDLRPMRPRSGRLPVGDAWSHELCWPGCRVLVASAGGRASIHESAGNDVGAAVPEVRRIGDVLASTEVVLDGVLVALDDDGAPTADADGVRSRLAAGDDRRGRRRPRLAVMLFDLLWLDGYPHLADPLSERRRLLTDLHLDGPGWQTPATSRVPPADLLEVATSRGFGALVAKRLDSPYRPGEESDDWVVGDEVSADQVS